jgi:hypothetical protein
MKSSSDAFDVAIVQGETVISHRLTHDWDNDGVDDKLDDITKFVSSISVNQELTSQLPQQTRIIEGGTSAELVAELKRGNVNWYGSEIIYKDVRTNTSGSSPSSLVTVARPTSVEGDIVVIFVAIADATTAVKFIDDRIDPERFGMFMLRGDTSLTTRVEGYGFTRRVGENEELTYRFPLEASYMWSVSAITIGNPGAAGLCAFMTKGQDPDSSEVFTELVIPEYEIPRDGCVVLSAFAASVAVTGASWTPQDGDTELADITTTSATLPNVVLGMQIATNVDGGRHTKSSVLSTSFGAGVGFSIALAPFPPGDELQHAAWTFSEMNVDGPYVGKIRTYRRVNWEIGFITDDGIERIRMFTGRTLANDGSSRSRNHTIVALDEREVMRSPAVSIPNVIAENPFLFSGETLPNFPGLEVTWAVSYLFLRSRVSTGFGPISQAEDQGHINGYGFFASPGPRRSNILYIPCHGSLHAFFSNNFSAYALTTTSGGTRRRVMFWDGPYVAATEQAPHNGGSIRAKWGTLQFSNLNDGAVWSDTDQTAGRIEFCARFFVPTSGGTITLTMQGVTAIHFVRFVVTQDGSLAWDLRQNGGATRTAAGPAVPTDTEWHWFGIHWDTTTGQAIFAIDGVETHVSIVALANNANTDNFIDVVLLMENGAQISEINIDKGIQSISGETSTAIVTTATPWLSDFVPNAFIDKSDTLLDGILFVDESADYWQLLQELAVSDFAAIYHDAFGQLHWRNGRSDASDEGQVIVRELTARDSLMDIDYTSGAAQIANIVSVGYTPIEIINDGDYYTPIGAIKVPANGSTVVTFQVPGPILSDAPFAGNLTAANTEADGSGVNVPVIGFVQAGFTIGGTSQFGTVTFENFYTFDVWIVDTSGQPSFTITASWYQQGPNAEPATASSSDSIRRYRPQPLSISSSIWRQRLDAAEMIAEQLVSDLSTPRPTIRNVRIIGDPRLELGDLTRIRDESGIGLDGNYRLSGMSSKYNPNGGFVQSITAREGPETADWDEDSWDSDEIWG